MTRVAGRKRQRQEASVKQQKPLTTMRPKRRAATTKSSALLRKRTHPEPLESIASDDELKRRRKKSRTPGPTPHGSQSVFAIGPTRKTPNRKKFSTKAKQRLKNPTSARVFDRSSTNDRQERWRLELGSTDLSQDLTAFATFVSLTPTERTFRQRVFEDMKGLVCRAFPYARVELYGSSSSGLETFRSDLDITVGNLDLSKRHQESVGESGIVSDEDSHAIVSTGSDDETVDDDEPTFSLNLSLPGRPPTSTNSPRPPLVPASTTLKSPWNPTLRRHKMRQLRALQQLLIEHRPQYTIKCLTKAKIPILMIVDRDSGLHIDLGVNREAFDASDHGRTTALVTQLQQTLGASFVSVVVFLKEFLHQFELDKPFTGGLGSYRLYMMVAYIFTTRCPGIKTSVSPATGLLTFLRVFGNHKFLTTETQLPVRHGGHMDVVDFHAVFRLDDCVEKFVMALSIIQKQGDLGGVVLDEQLETERRVVATRIHEYLEKEQKKKEEEMRRLE